MTFSKSASVTGMGLSAMRFTCECCNGPWNLKFGAQRFQRRSPAWRKWPNRLDDEEERGSQIVREFAMLPRKRLGARRRFFDPRDQETRIVQGGGVVLQGPMESDGLRFPSRSPPDRGSIVVSVHEETPPLFDPIRIRRLSDPAPGQRPLKARVRDAEQQTAAPPEDAVKFSERLLIPHDILEDDVRHDEVERLVIELREVGQVASGILDAARVERLLSACDGQQLTRMI